MGFYDEGRFVVICTLIGYECTLDAQRNPANMVGGAKLSPFAAVLAMTRKL